VADTLVRARLPARGRLHADPGGCFLERDGRPYTGSPGGIRWSWLPPLLLGSLFGGYLGAHLAIRSGNRWIKRAFELVTLLVGVKLILG